MKILLLVALTLIFNRICYRVVRVSLLLIIVIYACAEPVYCGTPVFLTILSSFALIITETCHKQIHPYGCQTNIQKKLPQQRKKTKPPTNQRKTLAWL
jgi:hypothetical protein